MVITLVYESKGKFNLTENYCFKLNVVIRSSHDIAHSVIKVFSTVRPEGKPEVFDRYLPEAI